MLQNYRIIYRWALEARAKIQTYVKLYGASLNLTITLSWIDAVVNIAKSIVSFKHASVYEALHVVRFRHHVSHSVKQISPQYSLKYAITLCLHDSGEPFDHHRKVYALNLQRGIVFHTHILSFALSNARANASSCRIPNFFANHKTIDRKKK